MDYTGRRPRIMDHDVTLEVFFFFFLFNLVLPFRVEIELIIFCDLLIAFLISLGEITGNPKVFC